MLIFAKKTINKKYLKSINIVENDLVIEKKKTKY